MTRFLLTVLLLAGLIGACKPSEKNKRKTSKNATKMENLALTGTAWQALHASDTTANSTQMHYTKAYVLRFDDTTRLQLRLDANMCRVNYTYTDGVLNITDLFSCTKKCCDSKDGLELRDMMAQKSWRVSLDANKNLILRSDANIEILFKPVVE
jgi:hypothetical protein